MNEAPGIDTVAVTRWLQAHTGVAPPLRFQQITGGRSNLTFLVTGANGERLVLRRPPLGDHPATAHDVLREGRLLRSLAGRVPVPAVLAGCDDSSVTGAPFVVLEHLDGLVLRGRADAAALPPPARRALGPRLVDALLALHRVDPGTLGLGRLAERRDYLGRQLRRWHENWLRTRVRELADLEHAHRWLVANAPEQRRTTLLHGDFRVDNVLLGADGTVLGILDWELSTVGDPLADLGQFLVYWAEPDDEHVALRDPPSRAEGFAGRDELRDRYLAATGDHPADIDYFIVFNWWKTACIVEGVYARMSRGEMGASDRTPESFGEQAAALAAHAARLGYAD